MSHTHTFVWVGSKTEQSNVESDQFWTNMQQFLNCITIHFFTRNNILNDHFESQFRANYFLVLYDWPGESGGVWTSCCAASACRVTDFLLFPNDNRRVNPPPSSAII